MFSNGLGAQLQHVLGRFPAAACAESVPCYICLGWFPALHVLGLGQAGLHDIEVGIVAGSGRGAPADVRVAAAVLVTVIVLMGVIEVTAAGQGNQR